MQVMQATDGYAEFVISGIVCEIAADHGLLAKYDHISRTSLIPIAKIITDLEALKKILNPPEACLKYANYGSYPNVQQVKDGHFVITYSCEPDAGQCPGHVHLEMEPINYFMSVANHHH